MNHEKTGALIAKRRQELGLTQKALAEKLNISDRAVSRWERGLGFPDISLIEAVADALNLTVLELLHGEEEPPTPEEERSARETLNNIRPEVHEKMKKSRRWIIILAILLAVVVVAVGVLCAIALNEWETKEITTAQAVDMVSCALITRQEYQLMETLRTDERIAYTETRTYLDQELCDEYFRQFILPLRNLAFYRISVSGKELSVEYGTERISCSLDLEQGTEGVIKRVRVYDKPLYLDENGYAVVGDPQNTDHYQIRNEDNQSFFYGGPKKGLAALFNGI